MSNPRLSAPCYCGLGRRAYACVTCLAWGRLWRELMARIAARAA